MITGTGVLVAGLAHASGAGVSRNPDGFREIRRAETVAFVAYVEKLIAGIKQNPLDIRNTDVDSLAEHVDLVRKIYNTGDWERARYERDRLYARVHEVNARPAKEARRRGGLARADPERDVKMAEEFLSKPGAKSPSDLKKKIGLRYGLGRSAAIEAINRGLSIIGKQK